MRFFPKNIQSSDSLQIIGHAAADCLPTRFNVLLWNIYKARRAQWRPDFTRLLQEQDLILLQEAVFNGVHDDLFLQPDNLQWVMAKSFTWHGIAHGTKTGAAATAQEAAAFHSAAQEPLSRTKKTLLATQYKIADGQENLLVLNMHAINFVSLAKFAAHMDQVAAAIAVHGGPILLGGDFNTWNRARFDYFTSMMRANNLSETPLTRQAKWRHGNRHLDHLFYRGLQLESAEVLADIGSSDHHPIQACFTVAS